MENSDNDNRVEVEFSPPQPPQHPQSPPAQPIRRKRSFFDKDRIWLNVMLFVFTIGAVYFVGHTSWSLNYVYADVFAQEESVNLGLEILLNPTVIWLSLIYAVVLIGILLAHEMGHYLTARYYRINATLPFFIPFPMNLIGTMGAFIKIRSPIKWKHQLFDIAVAGPLAGFAVALPAVVWGMSLTKFVPALPEEGTIIFGEPLLFKAVGALLVGPVPPGYDMIVHPMAFAGWVGVLVTALNLCPIGQLDGGHVVYAIFGSRSRMFAHWILIAFVLMGIFFWVGWFIWAAMIGFIGLRHPPIFDETAPLSPRRRMIGYLVLIIFIFSFIPDPVQGFNLFDVIKIFMPF